MLLKKMCVKTQAIFDDLLRVTESIKYSIKLGNGRHSGCVVALQSVYEPMWGVDTRQSVYSISLLCDVCIEVVNRSFAAIAFVFQTIILKSLRLLAFDI